MGEEFQADEKATGSVVFPTERSYDVAGGDGRVCRRIK